MNTNQHSHLKWRIDIEGRAILVAVLSLLLAVIAFLAFRPSGISTSA